MPGGFFSMKETPWKVAANLSDPAAQFAADQLLANLTKEAFLISNRNPSYQRLSWSFGGGASE